LKKYKEACREESKDDSDGFSSRAYDEYADFHAKFYSRVFEEDNSLT
jgi:hypothetical protein